MKQGEIWWVCFDPSVGHEFRKTRPAIIISSDISLRYSNLTTVMAITGNNSNCLRDDMHIVKDNNNCLFSNSIIKVTHIYSFDKERFIKKIGIADDFILSKIKNYLKKHFDIN